MKTSLDCISCFVRQATEAASFCVPEESRRAEILRIILEEIVRSDWNCTAPKMGQLIHRLIRRETGVVDPYAGMKRSMNQLAAELLPSLRQEARLADDPRAAMVRVATLLDDCSSEFRQLFEQSDLVISKGQGNYESLSETDKHIFYLLQVKCDCVARHLGVPLGATALCEKTGADQRVRSCALT